MKKTRVTFGASEPPFLFHQLYSMHHFQVTAEYVLVQPLTVHGNEYFFSCKMYINYYYDRNMLCCLTISLDFLTAGSLLLVGTSFSCDFYSKIHTD